MIATLIAMYVGSLNMSLADDAGRAKLRLGNSRPLEYLQETQPKPSSEIQAAQFTQETPNGATPIQQAPALPPVLREQPSRVELVPFGGSVETTPEAEQKFGRYVEQLIDPENTLDVQQGRPRLLLLKQIPFRIQIADESIADAVQITEREFSITGREVGSTVLNFWFSDPDKPERSEILSYLVRVFPDPEAGRRQEIVLEALEKEINRAFPNSAVRLTYAGNQVIVRGQAKDVEEATNILRIVSASVGQGDDGNLPINPNEFNFLADFNEIIDSGGLGNAVRGVNEAGVNANRINNSVINMLEIAGVHQIMLKVTVAEVNRSATRSLGASLGLAGSEVSFFSFAELVGNVASNVATGANSGGLFTVDTGDFDLALNVLRELNLARTLATPDLTTLNGQIAVFQAGGSFPVPVVTGATATGLQGTTFQDFGVSLFFTPVVTDKNRIRLQVNTSVSTLDEALAATVGNTNVPGLEDRTVSTTVELRQGETLAIAGLIQTGFVSGSARTPLLGDIPLLKQLFSVNTTSFDEQELVILVTPYLVGPLPEGTPLALPGSDVFEPDDFEFFILGLMEGCRAEDYRSPVRTDIYKMKQFRRLQQNYILGQPGYSNGGY